MTESVKSCANRAVKCASRAKVDRKTKQGLKTAAIGAGARAIGKTVLSVAKFVAAAGLIVATAAAAAAMVPRPIQKRIARDFKHTAMLTAN